MLSKPMLTSRLKAKAADAMVELHASIPEISDYREFPVHLESVIRKLFPIDWLVFGVFGQGPNTYSIVTNPSLPFDWNEKYADIYDYDRIRTDTFNQAVGGTYIYRRCDASVKSVKEEEVYLLETIKKHTDTSHFLTLHTAKTHDSDSAIGMYRAEENHPFSTHEKQVLDYLSPVLVSFSHTMMLYSEFDLKRVSLDKLAGSQKALTMSFNNRLEPLDIPKETKSFIKRHFPATGQRSIPDPIDSWIRQQISPKGCLEPNSGPWYFNICLPEMDLHCKAYTVVTDLKQLVLLIMLIPHNRPMDFSILQSEGLTKREVEAVSYLPLGYSNKQIAMAMDIEEVTVKKHLKNTAQKLGAVGKTDTLYKTIQKKELLETLHTC
jgi:DNA-binding CsgD family transcriptional regulator